MSARGLRPAARRWALGGGVVRAPPQPLPGRDLGPRRGCRAPHEGLAGALSLYGPQASSTGATGAQGRGGGEVGGGPAALERAGGLRACRGARTLAAHLNTPWRSSWGHTVWVQNPSPHLPAVSSWASDFTSPRFSFLIGKMGVVITVLRSKGWVNERIHEGLRINVCCN